ncbi:hypothetical protein A2801_00140 [Candidatus Woesebacteria bacterium RIFCSPHIGHO2_01_FULL_41_10]|uniref:50S ribosomal protein L19 n=1 Tax=Candidatus Woesebacteria bacterium RIFCSPHIGHO2_01_FULL_41_10 TaxID=1802500 RepID=A0A1F7YT00_9BACT|nr:MAG: hypothetical protein A2801_00140 [Candidatus Woesebacteria bacterium RIFCSPHIGHO2_01_FULL_41_10]
MAIKTTHGETTFGVGDVVRVHQLVVETGKEDKMRTQIFEGTVIGIRGKATGKSFIVRRVGAQNVGIEQIFPLHSPLIKKVEIKRSGVSGAEQAKLYYFRDKSRREIETVYKRAARRNKVVAIPAKSKSKPVPKRKLAKTRIAPKKKASATKGKASAYKKRT